MMTRLPGVSSISVTDLVELHSALQRDEERPRQEVLKRDTETGRAFASELGTAEGSADSVEAKRRWTLAWLKRTRDADRRKLRHRSEIALAVVGIGVILLGVLFGWLSTSAVFWYDGATPVNIVKAIVVFGLVNWALLLITMLAVVPWRSGGLRTVTALLSPGLLGGALLRILPGDLRQALDSVWTHSEIYGRVNKWLVVRWSQLMGVAFHVTAVLTFLGLVFFTDLAFGWATTLDLQSADAHEITSGLSAPWQAVWPAAVPSVELVERSRFFRGQAFEPIGRQSWWQFLLAFVLLYGLLPRVIALIWSHLRLKRALAATMPLTPGVTPLLARLQNAQLHHASTEHDDLPRSEQGEIATSASEATDEPAACTVGWGGLEGDLTAGGSQTLEQDRQTIASVGESLEQSTGAAVLRVKGWEPPVLDVVDFLADLRRALGQGRTIRVEVVTQGATGPGEAGLEVWRRQLAQLRDPWLTVIGTPSASS